MFEKEAEEYQIKTRESFTPLEQICWGNIYKAFKDGAEFGYNKANEWHYVKDELPEIDVLVYLWNKIDDYPVVACRHIPYGQEEWVWDCKWGSGFTISQSKGKDYSWKEIVLPKE